MLILTLDSLALTCCVTCYSRDATRYINELRFDANALEARLTRVEAALAARPGRDGEIR